MELLNPLRPYFTTIKLIGVGLLLAALAWQTVALNGMRDWRDHVIAATAFAVDEDDSDRKLPKVSAKDVPQHILNLGNFKFAALRLREKARADDAQNVIDTGRKVTSINKEQVNALTNARADLDRHYDTLVAQRVLRGGSAAIGNPGGRGETDLPGLPAASIGAAGPSKENQLPATCPAIADWSLDERYEASIYATQLDQLISAVEELAKINPNGDQQK